MNEPATPSDMLIRYLDGELQGDALAALEQQLSADPLLQQELENLRAAQQAVRSHGLRQQVSSIHAQMMKELNATTPQSKAPVRRLFGTGMRVAASIMVVVACAAGYLYQSLSPATLFEASYQPYSVATTRSEGQQGVLERLYLHDSMQQVIPAFSKLEQPSLQDYFYTGNAFLRLHQSPAAIRLFSLLQQKNKAMSSHILEEDTEYYLAMAYLQNNQPRQAFPLFEKIRKDPQHLYHDKVSAWFLWKVKQL